MFILYAVPIGLVAGALLGGRLDRLGELRFRWAWLAIAGLVAQIVLFADPVASSIGDLGPVVYVASTAAVLVAVVRDWRIPGMPIVALGAASNLLAIVANGGVMPASPEAVAAIDPLGTEGFSNSVVMSDPALRPSVLLARNIDTTVRRELVEGRGQDFDKLGPYGIQLPGQ